MQVSAISAQSFSGKRDNIDQAVAVSNDQIRQYAAHVAVERGKKRQKNINRLMLSVPMLAALAAGVLTKGNTTFLSKEVSGNAAKVANAVKEGTKWTALFGLGFAIGGINNAIERHSKGYRNFRQNHTMLSLLSDIGVFMAGLAAAPFALKAGYSKLGKNFIGHINKGIESMSAHLNNIHLPNGMKDVVTKVSDNTPELVKSAGKALIGWSPWIALFGGFLGSVNNKNKTAAEYYGTYEKISDAQQKIAQARINELKRVQQL